jgi:hypothetical protein
MKTTSIVSITSVLVALVVANAQFSPAQPQSHLPQPETVPGEGLRTSAEISDSGTLKITSPEATLELAPVEPKAAPPAPVPRKKRLLRAEFLRTIWRGAGRAPLDQGGFRCPKQGPRV